MNKAKKPTHKFNPIILVLLLGLVAFVVYVYFYVNPSQVISILSRTHLGIYAGAFVAYFLFALFSSFVWNRLLQSLSVKITKRKTLLFIWVGLFFDAAIPQLGWSGEASKTYLLAKDSKIATGKIGASVVGQKIFTMTISIVALSTGLGLLLLNYDLPPIATLIIAAILALSILSLAIIYYVSLKSTALKTLLNWAIKIMSFFRKQWNPQNFKGKAEEILNEFHKSFCQLTDKPKELVLPIVYAVTSFVFEISVVFITFLALGYPVPIDRVLIVFTLAGTLQTVGVTFFGFPEIVMTSAFTALGIQVDVSFAVTLLTRVVNLWFRLTVSYLALQWAGIKIIRQIRKTNKETF